jgi:Trypsin
MRRLPTIITLAAGLAAVAGTSAQTECTETRDGRICRVQQPITAGTAVSLELQQQLGLITIATPSGSCSGTMLNPNWVLTARHCIGNSPPTATLAQAIAAPPHPTGSIAITANWMPGASVNPSLIREFAVNAAPGVMPTRDIVLLYLGGTDFGDVNAHIPYITQRQVTSPTRWVGARLAPADRVNQYGRGLSTFATGVVGGSPPATPAGGSGTYRTAVFTASNVTQTGYTLAMNGNNQVGHGGDSGGATFVTASDGSASITGVQSACVATGYLANAPANNWSWATGISSCSYVSVEPFVLEIGRAMGERPACQASAQCAIVPVFEAMWP